MHSECTDSYSFSFPSEHSDSKFICSNFRTIQFNIDVRCFAWCDILNMLPHSFSSRYTTYTTYTHASFNAAFTQCLLPFQLLISCHEDGFIPVLSYTYTHTRSLALPSLSVSQLALRCITQPDKCQTTLA